ncbi:Arf3-interacting protein 1, N-terminal domain protein [Nannochloropsis gaditana]|uniref:Arf3-interacting protein 1, N-terminal domain protein n=1 Tax=Nannochloropsis gaditana TaxID=72520 RepID=W7T7H5_9STRA|nr:Arf3-interacting protein 1, N-terminal domain protein [Nannochloropsis gaditana]
MSNPDPMPTTPFPLSSGRTWHAAAVAAAAAASAAAAADPLVSAREGKAGEDSGSGLVVHHIVLSEFDIVTGSTVRYQYPRPVPGESPDSLAEKMLPEGAHSHAENETWFFFNRGSLTWDEQEAAEEGGHTTDDRAGEENDRVDGESMNIISPAPPFLYGYSIVKTQRDPHARRGAWVKALALVSPLPILEALRPAMALALDECFSRDSHPATVPAPPPEAPPPALPPSSGGEDALLQVIRRLFHRLNALDLRQIPRPTLLERQLMRRGVCTPVVPAADLTRPDSVYHPSHPAWRRRVSLPWADLPQGLQAVGGGREEERGRTSPALTHPQPRLPRPPEPVTLSLAFSLPRYSDEAGRPSLAWLLRRFPDDLMRIYQALLLGKRLLFLTVSEPAASACRAVLSSLLLLSPPFLGLLRRAFPYVSLADLSFLQLPSPPTTPSVSDKGALGLARGYVAGATNPVFARREEWWDLLCDLDRGRCFLPGEAGGGEGEGDGGTLGGRGAGREGGKGGVCEYLEGELLSGELDAAFSAHLRATMAAAYSAPLRMPSGRREVEGGGGAREGAGTEGGGLEEYLRVALNAHTQALVALADEGGSLALTKRSREVVGRMAMAQSHRVQRMRQWMAEAVRGKVMVRGREGKGSEVGRRRIRHTPAPASPLLTCSASPPRRNSS